MINDFSEQNIENSKKDKQKISAMAKAARLPDDRFRNLITSEARGEDYRKSTEEYDNEQKSARDAQSREENKTGFLEDFGGGIGREY